MKKPTGENKKSIADTIHNGKNIKPKIKNMKLPISADMKFPYFPTELTFALLHFGQMFSSIVPTSFLCTKHIIL